MSLPNLSKLLATYVAEVQALEDALYALILGRTVGYATGGTLDRIGAMVGAVKPSGATQDTWRALIYARITTNTSHGGPEALYALLRLLGVDSALVRETFPAGVQIQYRGYPIVPGSAIRHLLEAATSPVEIRVSEAVDDAFGFASDSTAYGFGVGNLSHSW